MRQYLWPNEVVAIARNDIEQFSPADQPFIRYVWHWENTAESRAVVSFTVNTVVNQGSSFRRIDVCGGGWLSRLHLGQLAPAKHFDRVVATWEKMVDPHFHTVTIQEKAIKVFVPKYKASDGKWYDYKYEKQRVEVFGFNVLTNHGNGEAMVALANATKSSVPIVSEREFLRYALQQTEGGLYYDFMGFNAKPKGSGQTDQAFMLSLFGASESQVQNLRSDERTATWFSRVTAKPRRADFFFGVGIRPSAGFPLITITHDVQDGDIEPGRHPIKNLLDFDDRGREAIVMRPNGTLAYALFDGNGNLVDSVPDGIAQDHTIPIPHTARLRPPASCISCHGPHDGYQPFPNDIQAMMRSRTEGKQADIFDDVSKGTSDPLDTLDRLAGLYTGDLSGPLRIARNSHEAACYRIASTSGLRLEPGRYCREISSLVTKRLYEYLYNPVTPKLACRELGFVVNGENHTSVFKRIVPLLPGNRFGVSPDDPTIIALRAWTPEHPLRVRRDDWREVFPDVMLRVLTAAQQQ